MRANVIALASLVLLSSLNAGCGWFGSSQPTGGVAVVDLDEVARQVGASDEIAVAIKSREANLNSQLQAMKSNYVQQLKDRKNLYGDNPTDAQNKQLIEITNTVKVTLASAQQKAASHLSSHRGQLILKFREQVSPIAREIAKQRGLSIVVPKNEGWLLAVDESVDITDEVIESLKSSYQPITTSQPLVEPQPQIASRPETQDSPAGGTGTPQTSGHGSSVQPAGYAEPTTP